MRAEVATLKEGLGVWQGAGAHARTLPQQQEAAALQRYRAQIWQQQRQIALMGAEMKVGTHIRGVKGLKSACTSVHMCMLTCFSCSSRGMDATLMLGTEILRLNFQL